VKVRLDPASRRRCSGTPLFDTHPFGSAQPAAPAPGPVTDADTPAFDLTAEAVEATAAVETAAACHGTVEPAEAGAAGEPSAQTAAQQGQDQPATAEDEAPATPRTPSATEGESPTWW
jgi:hypothetical protein